MNGRIRSFALLVVLPLRKGQLQEASVVRVMGIEPLREHLLQHGDREERPGDLNQREPFVVVAGRGHGELSSNGFGAQIQSNLLVLVSKHGDGI